MERVCKGGPRECVSFRTLTASTGLSLAESVAHVAERDGLALARAQVGRLRGFFSYSWTGTKLDEMLGAIEDVVVPLDDAAARVWVDMFCASQNLLAGAYLPADAAERAALKAADPGGYAARKEDTDRIFDDALSVAREVYFYASPLVGTWLAPRHAFLSPQREARGAPPEPWERRGAAAITRAWCLFELASALVHGCKLHVALSRADRDQFRRLLTDEFDAIAGIVAGIDARDAQISKVEDRGHILPRIEALAPEGAGDAEDAGFGRVTALVAEALRGWLVYAAKAELAALPAAEQGTSCLLSQVGRLLQDQGKLGEAEPLLRAALEGRREVLRERHPDTLSSMNNLGLLLRDQGKLGEAEPVLRPALEGRREVLGERHPDTLSSMNNLASLLYAHGKLGEAEPLCRGL